MIELFYWPTPNGRKVSIMLEETKIKYKVTSINLGKEEQFKPEFLKINPYGKIPAIIDHEKDLVLIESGAILIYLARKSNQFLHKENEIRIFEWLMFQTGNVGPMLGQHHHFHHFNPGKSKYAEDRFFKNSIRVYEVLDKILSKNNYLAGEDYSIADISTFPWIARHNWHDIGLKKYKHLSKWYEFISDRSAVKKGYDCLNTGEQIPKI
ncbi:MAG TPA: glutathione S-transferase [Pelagibacteraceae bacterium]|jgi:GST-like protein|nr:glutathione S-transferase N-terminal domain-containing protein [Pelagibacterales bacterium]RUA13458.1 MAG: glutathione S-transferase [Alphaproteobacteria bacterium]HIN07325.1 glutathione S-transferase [Pelagibacteraceae bacterium]